MAAATPWSMRSAMIEHLDLRDLPPPEPLNRIVEALRSLAPGHRLDALTPFPPMPLLPILQRQGFAWRIDELPTGHARVSICRKEDASVLLTADPLR
ncbi:DUF2249 domain-containing protein [Dokdonella sp.]|uniref:DUF2249 domain-containing protein n=1 Tax=Dokdonella sp. TaxID=2291710 RepID=UPI0025C0510B|nr:DUF2249 domain-containing protein [Dokdonella sp.]MBX3690657.1 DUF2249 domain-containing protein [Dokdonella sp.]MCW5567551.1 DUF2249 domain-containing protein [Dokdonella sp.]